MKQKCMVLRSKVGATRDVFLGTLSAPTAPEPIAAGLSVEVYDLERSTVPTLTRDREVVAVAPVLPMKLISPINVELKGQQVIDGKAWGVRAVAADTSPFSGDGIVVAVLDTGIDSSHPAFSGVVILENDFTGEGNGDRHGHGTHCAGTIFGRDIDGTRIGIARGVKKALIGKVIGQKGGSSESIVQAIRWAIENGANVVSMSLGMDFPGYQKQLQDSGFPPELATSRALEGYRANVQLFERLASLVRAQGNFAEGAVIVAAAGNESRREVNPDFEIAVSPPAVAEGIISVAALDSGDQGLTVAPFSNTGANVSAPGVGILSAKLGGGSVALSGTSMATPHVAGVAALWGQKIRASQPISALRLTSLLLGQATQQNFAAGFDPFDVGAGLVRAPQN